MTPRIVEETKPIEEIAKIKTVPETTVVVQQLVAQEVINHAPMTITVPPSTMERWLDEEHADSVKSSASYRATTTATF